MGPISVLIVDDSPLMQRMVAELLGRDPLFRSPEYACNGLEGLNRIAEQQPDLVIMDIEMPEMDGLTALKHIMHAFPVPVVMLSSYTTEGSAQTLEAMGLGAVDFFHKDVLFGRPPQPMAAEDFLLRCKIAANSRRVLPPPSIPGTREAAVKVLLESITYFLKIEEELRLAQEELRNTLRWQSGLVVKFKEEEGRFVHTMCEGVLLRQFGFRTEQIVGADLYEIFPLELAAHFERHYRRAWNGEDLVSFEAEWKGKVYLTNLRPIRRQERVIEALALSVDITEQKRAEERMAYLANHDHLTGLPNRRMMQLLLRDMLQLPSCMVLFLDLDNFKLVNDTLGSSIGDQLLQTAARRLQQHMRDGSTVIRAGSDEFVILSGECSYERVAILAEQLIQEMRKPFRVLEHEVYLSASMGISRFPDDAGDAEGLLKYADLAMHSAKERGRNQVRFYNPSLNDQFRKRMGLELGLRKALEQQEFILQYQPVVDVRSGEVVSLECLIRWSRPEWGIVSPLEFIPVAEEIGLIDEIGEWVLTEACRQNRAWQDAGLPPVPVAVNLSSKQFYNPKLVETIERVLEMTGLDPSCLELEITESTTMNVDMALFVLDELKRRGLRIAIDDFGTGYSSLSYLKKFPIDKLKIDQSFVKGLLQDEVDAAIVNTILLMANNLKLLVVAEGVENEEIMERLQSLGCSLMQGYLFSRPVGADEAACLLAGRFQI